MDPWSQRLFRRATLTLLVCALIPGCFKDCDRDFDEDATAAPVCVDYDGDGYGDLYPGEAVPMNYPRARIACLQSLDCDDQDPDNWDHCDTCQDRDGDGWYGKCDVYDGVNGPDCDDTNPNAWASCATCVDRDGDGWFAKCDSYTGIQGPDCDDSDVDNWLSCASCRDDDGDSSFVGCDAYTIRNGVDCDDGDSLTYPGAEEICDGLDNDCDGNSDGGVEVFNKIGPDLRVTDDSWDANHAALVWTGSEYGMIWRSTKDRGSCFFARLSSDGSKIGSDSQLSAYASWDCSIAWTGSEYGAVWVEKYNSFANRVSFSRIGSDGAPIGSISILAWGSIGILCPSLSWTGSEFGVIWNRLNYGTNPSGVEYYYTIELITIDSTGSPISPIIVLNFDNVGWFPYPTSVGPAFSWTGSEFGAIWVNYSGSVNFVRISADSSMILPPLTLYSYGMPYFTPSLSWTGSEFGAIWRVRPASSAIYFSRISPDGAKIGSNLQAIDNTSNKFLISWTGSEYGLIWDYDAIYFGRISSDGTKIDPDLRLTSPPINVGYPAFAWTGSEFGVSWDDKRDGSWEIYFTRLGLTCP